MTRWWKGVAAVAVCLGLGVTAFGQTASPSPVGAARMPEPVRYDPGPIPNLVPGPLTPEMAPAGPPPGMDLNARHSNAFPVEKFSVEESCWFHFGVQWLARYKNDHLPLVFRDPSSFLDSVGATPVPGTLVGDPGTLSRPMQIGPRASMGYLMGNWGFEVTGFYMPNTTSQQTIIDTGRLAMPFGNGDGTPPGAFTGNNGLWVNADLATYKFQWTMAGAEFNCRTWNGGLNTFELLVGARYMYLRERLTITANDDFSTQDGFGVSDAALAATYRSQVETNFGGLQIGTEWSYEVPYTHSVIWLDGMMKGAWGVTRVDRGQSLVRGDGQTGFNYHTIRHQFGQLYELQAGLDFHVLEKCRLRMAYQALWLLGTSNPTAGVDFNLQTQGMSPVGYKGVLFHGPLLELQFLF